MTGIEGYRRAGALPQKKGLMSRGRNLDSQPCQFLGGWIHLIGKPQEKRVKNTAGMVIKSKLLAKRDGIAVRDGAFGEIAV